MGNIYTGSNSGKAGLNVKKTDDTVDVFGVNQIQLDSNLSLTDNGAGSVTIQSSGGGGGGSVDSVSFGSTGFLPSSATTGIITMTGTLNVGSGGTGATSLTDGGILLGSGTGAITVTSQPTNGQLLIGSTGTDPVLATLTDGTGITITEGAGTITVATDGTSPTGTGAANQVAYWSGANTLTGNNDLTWDGQTLKIIDTSDGTLLQVESTSALTGSAPDIVYYANRAAPGNGDDLGVIVFKGNDSGGAAQEFARISAEANTVTAGSEDGQLDFRVFQAGSITSPLRITESGVFVNIANNASLDFVVDTQSVDFAFQVDSSQDDIRTQVPFRDEIEIRSTDAGAAVAPDLKLYRNSGSPAANDVIGQVLFSGEDSASVKVDYASITGFIVDATTTAQDGAIVFNCVRNGTSAPYFEIGQLTSGVRAMTVNPNGLDNDFIVETTGQALAFKIDGSADTASMDIPLTINQQTTGTAGLTLVIDDDGATASPDLKLLHNSATPLANDDLGHIHFQGKNSAAATVSYADIYADILDPTDTVEAGRMFFRVRTATNSGNLTDMMSIRGDGSPCVVVNDSGRADVDFRVETDNQNSAFLMDASADNATFNVDVGIGTTPSSSLHVSTADNIIAKFLSTDGTAAIELADNATTNNAVLTRVGQTLTLCANGGDVAFGNSIGSYNGAAPTNGQLLIGDTATGLFDKGTLTSTGGTVTITNGAGTINLEAAGGGGTPAGSDTPIQFNNAGAFGANSGLTYNNATTPPSLSMGSGLSGVATQLQQNAGSTLPIAPFTATPGGSITSTQSLIELGFNAGASLANEIHGLKLQPTDYQVKTGKTTTQSFGQTQNTIIGLGGGAQVVDCYPSQGGLIVVIGAATAITVNLTLAQDSALNAYDSTAKPFLSGGSPPTNTSDLNGYGTWQIGDQVTVLANLTLGVTPNITVRSYNSETNGTDGTATSAPVDDPSRATKINGVDSDTVGGGGQTITTNYTAKTFILCLDQTDPLGVSWVAIG